MFTSIGLNCVCVHNFVPFGCPYIGMVHILLIAAAGSTPNFDMLHSTQSFAPIYVIEISISRLSIFKMS